MRFTCEATATGHFTLSPPALTKIIFDLPLYDTTQRFLVRDTQIDLNNFDVFYYVGKTEINYSVIRLADAG